MDNQELISIIIATYNRSNVLQYTIKSVLRSSYNNWELIVVGDACTDDTGDVVASFRDDRIRFFNLENNFGEQSAANNYGLKVANGGHIAFLNHDDLWFYDHLEKGLLFLKEKNADLVANSTIAIYPDCKRIINLESDFLSAPVFWAPASSWIFKKELVRDVGYWKSYRESYLKPSQEWLVRCWEHRKKVVCNPAITVITIWSGVRKDVYKNREYRENEYYFNRICEDNKYRSELLSEIIYDLTVQHSFQTIRRKVKSIIRLLLYKIFKIHPSAALNFVKHVRKGGYIDYLRRRRGLEVKR